MKRSKAFALDGLLVMMAMALLFLTLMAWVTEKQVMDTRAAKYRDACDAAVLASFTEMRTDQLSQTVISFRQDTLPQRFKEVLAANLKLQPDLTPAAGSLVDGPVVVRRLEAHVTGLPVTCAGGALLDRPSVCLEADFPVRPALLRRVLAEMTGHDSRMLHLHMDVELPLNN